MPCIIHDTSSSICNTTGTAPTGRTKATDVRPCGPKLHHYYLYQITCLSVKENSFIILAYLVDITMESCKMSKVIKKSLLSKAKKHLDFQVTL